MELKIGHLTYKVEQVDKEHMEAASIYGSCNHEKQTIKLSKEMTKERHAEVLLHEIIHAVFHAYNIRTEDGEERVTTSLANGLTQVFVDNPDLMEMK